MGDGGIDEDWVRCRPPHGTLTSGMLLHVQEGTSTFHYSPFVFAWMLMRPLCGQRTRTAEGDAELTLKYLRTNTHRIETRQSKAFAAQILLCRVDSEDNSLRTAESWGKLSTFCFVVIQSLSESTAHRLPGHLQVRAPGTKSNEYNRAETNIRVITRLCLH